jgi:hypothetical protein
VDALVPSKLSLMPDNVVSQITYEQFIDLLAFLKSKSEQEALRGLVAEASVAPAQTADLKVADKPAEAAWKPLSAGPDGTFDLKPAFGATGPAVYLRAYVFAPTGQTAQLAVTGANPWRAWVNGAPAESAAVELKKGWNAVLVKVANAGKPAALAVRVTGSDLRTSASDK